MTRVVQSKGNPSIRQVISLEPDANSIEVPISSESSFEDASSRFWAEVASVPTDMWGSERMVYLYRDNPHPNTKGSAQIEKVTKPIDIDWVRKRWGGYDYRAMLVGGERWKLIGKLAFSIDAPPKYPGPDGEPVEPGVAVPIASASASLPSSDGITALVGLMREQNNAMLQMLERVLDRVDDRDSAPHQNGKLQEIALDGVVQMLKASIPQQQDPFALLVKMKELSEPRDDFLTQLAKAKQAGLIPGASEGGTDLVGQLEKVLIVAERLGMKSGGKEPGVLQVLAEKSPEIMSAVGSIVERASQIADKNVRAQEYRYKTAVAMGQTREPVTIQATPGPNVPPAAVPNPAQPPIVASPLDLEPLDGQPVAIAPNGAITPESVEVNLPLLNLLKERIVDCIARGMPGEGILNFVEGMDPQLIPIFEAMTEEQLVEFFSSDAILQQATKLPRFKKTIKEIVHAFGGEDLPPDNVPEEQVN